MEILLKKATNTGHVARNQPAAWAFGSLGFRFAGGGGRWRADMASGGKGFGTERARLAGDGLLTERARLAQGGYCEKALAQNVQD